MRARALSTTSWSTVPKSRLSLMRRLASLSRDSYSLRASFSRAGSPAFPILFTSVQVRNSGDFPAHRAVPADGSGLAENYTGKNPVWGIGS